MRGFFACLAVALLAAACGGDNPADADADADIDVGSGSGSPDSGSPSAEPVSERVSYADGELRFGDLRVPGGDGPFPVVVFIHGGFWRNSFGLDLAEPQAADAAERGYATWNVEYRRVGDPGGGYPGTLVDVAAAIDHLADLAADHRLDLDRVAVVGHSAGGHLALWAGQRERLASGAPGAEPVVVPTLVVGLAPVADLARNLDLGGGAVAAFMGATPDDDPGAYDIADPARLLPIAAPQLIIQGADDGIVPPGRADAYAALVDRERGLLDESLHGLLDVEVFANADHFDVIDPSHESWAAVVERLEQGLG